MGTIAGKYGQLWWLCGESPCAAVLMWTIGQQGNPQAFAKAVGIHFRNAIRKAGEDFDLRCPMDGEYKIGDNWSETH